MKQKNKVEISWAFGVNPTMQIDFGRFLAHKGNKIKVEENFWRKYCDLRLAFETAHQELVEKIKLCMNEKEWREWFDGAMEIIRKNEK